MRAVFPVHSPIQEPIQPNGTGAARDDFRLQIYGSDDRFDLVIEPADDDPTIRGALGQRSDFHRARHTKDGLQGWCRSCMRSRMHAWRRDNPDKVDAWLGK